MEISEAMKVITKAIKTDPSYKEGWVANIAMAFQDAFRRNHPLSAIPSDDIHKISNEAANDFLKILCM